MTVKEKEKIAELVELAIHVCRGHDLKELLLDKAMEVKKLLKR